MVFCKNCKTEHPEGTQHCFVMPIEDKKPTAAAAATAAADPAEEEDEEEEEEVSGPRNTKIFFDFECKQDREVSQNKIGPIFVHEPNLCVALKVCDKCKEAVKQRQFNTCDGCGQNEWIFAGQNCKRDFCEWLFSAQNVGSIAIAHNSKVKNCLCF